MNTITTNVEDIYESLSRGVYDSCYFAIAPMQILKLHEVSKAVLIPKITGITMFHLVNLDTWNSLPTDLQQVFRDAAAPTADFSITLNEEMEAQTIKAFQEEYGIEVNTLSPEDQAILFKFLFEEWGKSYKALCERAGVWDDGQVIVEHVMDFAHPK